jgi:hypothetical protein
MDKEKNIRRAIEIFAAHSGKDEVYFASDGQAFFNESDRNNHLKSLKDKSTQTVLREDVQPNKPEADNDDIGDDDLNGDGFDGKEKKQEIKIKKEPKEKPEKDPKEKKEKSTEGVTEAGKADDKTEADKAADADDSKGSDESADKDDSASEPAAGDQA